MIDWWAQGMRSAHDRPHRQPWQEVIYNRLTHRHERVLQGMRTEQAQRGLGLGDCAYFYLGRCDPAYSEYAIVFSRPACAGLRVTPFDTGGLWWSYIVTTVSLNGTEKAALVAKYTMVATNFMPEFMDWALDNYHEPMQYNLGEQPKAAYAFEIDLGANRAGERAWTWEARVPVAETREIQAARVFLRDQEYGQYTQWLLNNVALNQSDKMSHIREISNLVAKCGTRSPGFAANEWMREEMQWTAPGAS